VKAKGQPDQSRRVLVKGALNSLRGSPEARGILSPENRKEEERLARWSRSQSAAGGEQRREKKTKKPGRGTISVSRKKEGDLE